MAVGISNLWAAPKNCPTINLVNREQTELPADTAAQVTMLQQYGARYARVVGLILEENAKPEWTFVEDCSPQIADLFATNE